MWLDAQTQIGGVNGAPVVTTSLQVIGGTAPVGANAPQSFYTPGQTGGAAATASSNGNTGSVMFLIAGDGSAGGATSGNGGTGGTWTLGGGNGGSAAGGNSNGGSGGANVWGIGNGGNGIGTGSGGNAGTFSIANGGTGVGGNAGTSGGNGGAGADLNFNSGTGGTSTVGTAGRGGNINFVLGPQGSTGTATTDGKISITRGSVRGTLSPLIDLQDNWQSTNTLTMVRYNLQQDTGPSNTASLLFDVQLAGTTEFHVDKTGITTAQKLASLTNCAAIGTAANPSVSSCTSASAGSISCAATQTVCQVNTTAVTANSEIFLSQREDTTTGTRLSVTCNTTPSTVVASQNITAVVAGTSFTFSITAPAANPDCFSYLIVN